MAAVVLIRQFLMNVIGFPDDVSANKVIEQGINSFSALHEFDDNDIKVMCNALRKGGGLINDPNHAGAGPILRIANPGMVVTAIQEKRLTMSIFGARIYNMIGRPIDASSLSLPRLNEFRILKEVLGKHEDEKTSLPEVTRNFGIVKALDAFASMLQQKIGIRGVPLSYVIRLEHTPPPLQNLINNEIHSAQYPSLLDELVAHAPLSGQEYKDDNARVFTMLCMMLEDTPYSTSLKRHRQKQDGREAWKDLNMHNMGEHKWFDMVSKAEEVQTHREWNGRNSRFTLKMHITNHRDAYSDMVRAEPYINYSLPTEHQRVTRLLKSITADNITQIASAKSTIEGDPVKRNNFELAADFLLRLAPKTQKDSRGGHRISAVTNFNPEVRYYTASEWNALTKQQQAAVRAARDNNNGQKDGSKGKGNQHSTRGKRKRNKISALKENVKELKQRIASLTNSETPSEDNSHSSQNATSSNKKVKFNQRNNGADE